MNPCYEDPWSRTVRLLGWVSAPSEDRADLSLRAMLPGSVLRRPSSLHKPFKPLAEVTIVERLSEITAAVTWHDPTLCNYESQIWRVGLARVAGQCALSGARIIAGESIYRPIGQPANAGAMIRTAVIDRALERIATEMGKGWP